MWLVSVHLQKGKKSNISKIDSFVKDIKTIEKWVLIYEKSKEEKYKKKIDMFYCFIVELES